MEILAVLIALLVPTIAGAVRWLYYSGSLARQHEQSKADREEVRQIHDCLDSHARGINWIGDAVEKLANHQRVSLPPRTVVPERERE